MAATAVSMAMNLRLSQAMTYARTLRNQKKPDEPPSEELMEALDKARLVRLPNGFLIYEVTPFRVVVRTQ